MLKSKNLKSELASAALAIGIVAGAPSFAQDSDGFINNAPPLQETVIVQDDANSSTWTIDPYSPEVPEGVLWAMALLAAAFTLNAARNRMEGAWLRAGAAGVAAVYLANPQIVSEDYQNLSTETLILVDVSDSQNLDGRDILTQETLVQLEQNLNDLGVEPTIVEFGDDAVAGTHIWDTIQSSLSTIPADQLGAIFILTDGEIHDLQTVMDRLNVDAPVHGLISGQDEEQDFRITIDRAPRYSDVDEALNIDYRILNDHTLVPGDYTANVVIRNNGEVIANQTLNDIGSVNTIQLPNLQRGDNNIEIILEGIYRGNAPDENILQDDVSSQNNHITTTIEGIGESVNVLLISGAPNQGTRHFREILSADPDVNFVHFAFLRPPALEDDTPLRYFATTAFPVHEVLNENIEDYDAIIFENYTYNGVIPPSYFNNIVEFVENGGSLYISGSESFAADNGLGATSLVDILPLRPNGSTIEESFVPQISELGERYPLSRNLEYTIPQEQWGSWYSIASSTAQGESTVLLQDNDGNPLLATREYGEGRIAVLASDQNVVWDRLQNGRGGGPAETLTNNVLEWLMFNETMDEENIRLIHDGDQIIVELQTISDDPESVTVTSPSGNTIQVTPEDYAPGLRRAFIAADELGVYSVERAGENQDFAFAEIGFSDPLEMRRVISTPEFIQPLADATGGVVTRMGNLPDIIPLEAGAENQGNSMGIYMSDEKELSGVSRYPIPPWIPMLMIAGLFAGALKREGGKPWKETLFGSKRKTNTGDNASAQTPDIG